MKDIVVKRDLNWQKTAAIHETIHYVNPLFPIIRSTIANVKDKVKIND